MPLPDFLALVDCWSKQQELVDWRVARICYVIAAAIGGKKEGGGDFTIEDFMPGRKSEQTAEEIYSVLMSMTGENNGHSR